MIPLIVEGNEVTLTFNLNKELGIFEFSGRSRPENVMSFFEPIFEWFDDYAKNPNPETIIKFKLEYYNSSSAKVILRLLVRFEEMFKQGVNIKVQWCYRENDEDILESGEDYATLVEVPFEFLVCD